MALAGMLAAVTLVVAADGAAAVGPKSDAAHAGKAFPRAPNIGGVYPIEGALKLPAEQAYRLVFDVTDALPAVGIHSGLEHAARALNLYAHGGVPAQRVTVAAVVHGEATPMVLRDEDYRREFGVPNPNHEALQTLDELGVRIEVCGQALRSAGYEPAQVAAPVTVARSAITSLVQKQAEGYALLP